MDRSRTGLLLLAFFSMVALAAPIRPTLINGNVEDPSVWKQVVKITTGLSGCTATVVGPRVILTAAHCAATGATSTFTVNGGKTYSAKMTRSALYPNPSPGLDIALGVTSEDIAGVTPFSIGGVAAKGNEVLLLGYGCTTTSAAGSDGKLRSGKSLITEVTDVRFTSSTGSGALLCPGDSGGPAFYRSGNTLTVVGVNSAVGVTEDGTVITGPNYNARLDGTKPAGTINDFIAKNNVKICGINLNCGQVAPVEPSCTLASSVESVVVDTPLTLLLSAQNAVSAQINGMPVAVPNGQLIVTPRATGSQTANAVVTASDGKTASCSKTFTVTPKDPGPIGVSCALTATPSVVNLGESVTLELNATGAVDFGSIDGTQVTMPSGKRILVTRTKGDFSAVGFVRGAAGSANCFGDYRVNEGGVVPPELPIYGVIQSYCGADFNSASTGISKVCLGTVKKDPAMVHSGFTEAVTVAYNDGSTEVLPILARRPVAGSSVKDELGLFANAVVAGSSGATMDMRLATVTKGAGGLPASMEGKTKLNKNFRTTLTPQ